MPQIPSRLPREYESPGPDHRTRYTGVVNTVLKYSNVLHLHQRVCHKVDDTMVRTSRFTQTLAALVFDLDEFWDTGTQSPGSNPVTHKLVQSTVPDMTAPDRTKYIPHLKPTVTALSSCMERMDRKITSVMKHETTRKTEGIWVRMHSIDRRTLYESMHDEQLSCLNLTERRRTTVRFLGQQSEMMIDDTCPQAGQMRSLWKGTTKFRTNEMPQDDTWEANRHHSTTGSWRRDVVTCWSNPE